MGKLHHTLNDYTVWPCPGDAMSQLEWRLRYADPANLTTSDLVCAASVVAAYRALIEVTGDRRAAVVGQLRRAIKANSTKVRP